MGEPADPSLTPRFLIENIQKELEENMENWKKFFPLTVVARNTSTGEETEYCRLFGTWWELTEKGEFISVPSSASKVKT